MTTEALIPYRDQLATERGISDEDRDLLLTGNTEEWLLMQADLLSPAPKLTDGNVAPKEGRYVHTPTPDRTMSDFTQELIHGRSNDL